MSSITTYTGRTFELLDPKPEQIHILDIAHSLSKLNRFNGHLECCHYSVSQHCVLVSWFVKPELAKLALLHDASEAYVGDMTSPLKAEMPDYKKIENKISEVIYRRFALDISGYNEVKSSDRLVLNLETRTLRHKERVGIQIDPLPAEKAELEFLKRFAELFT
jgi:uncharacterized protein